MWVRRSTAPSQRIGVLTLTRREALECCQDGLNGPAGSQERGGGMTEIRATGPSTEVDASWTVGDVANRAHVSVRTLHHYDEIGLVTPRDRTAAGYRLYGPEELERLHQVLLFRELGLSLDAIAGLLGESAAERQRALVMQRQALEARRRRTDVVIRAVDRAIHALERGGAMSETELFEGFDDFDQARYEDEAKERWGHTEAYAESRRRTKGYGKADWSAVKEEGDGIMARMAERMWEGADADGEAAMDVAEEHRRHIGLRFYDCSPKMHAGLADMYEADARFGEYFEKRAEGLTAFVSAAIRANAERRERE